MERLELDLSIKQDNETGDFERLISELHHWQSELFKMMEVAEEEIAAMMDKYPERAGYIWNSFGMFGQDASLFSRYHIDLWRHHCRELLQRVAVPPSQKEERELGTMAEVMIGICEASLVQPLSSDATFAYAKMFREVFGDEKVQWMIGRSGVEIHESYPGAIDELISWARKKASKARNYPTEPRLPNE